MDGDIKEARGATLSDGWRLSGAFISGAAPSSKLKQAFLGKNCVRGVPSPVNRMFN